MRRSRRGVTAKDLHSNCQDREAEDLLGETPGGEQTAELADVQVDIMGRYDLANDIRRQSASDAVLRRSENSIPDAGIDLIGRDPTGRRSWPPCGSSQAPSADWGCGSKWIGSVIAVSVLLGCASRLECPCECVPPPSLPDGVDVSARTAGGHEQQRPSRPAPSPPPPTRQVPGSASWAQTSRPRSTRHQVLHHRTRASPGRPGRPRHDTPTVRIPARSLS